MTEANAGQGSSREKIRGSPRFPHRIVPANSMSALSPGSISAAHQKWHSMEDASKRKLVNFNKRGFSNAPIDDVWATRETGIPLSELSNSAWGRWPADNRGITTILTGDPNLSPDDVLLGSDLQKLFRENSTISCEYDNDTGDENSSKYLISSSPTSTKVAIATISQPETMLFTSNSSEDARETSTFQMNNQANGDSINAESTPSDTTFVQTSEPRQCNQDDATTSSKHCALERASEFY